ncbi:MAG TPA: hypothetical protein VFS60_13860, partial [Thermoanaerobaculia bacterium]|nr:hypothetical protein [Thermoanaerobaculia bacterium]
MHELLRRLLPFALLAAIVTGPAGALSHVAGADLATVATATRVGDRLQVTEVELPATSETLALDVERFEVFAPDAAIVVHGADGVQELPAPANAYFRG